MYRILIAIILMLPTFSHAINYLGLGGGTYVYAEQGNLYFNLEPNVFDNRAWTYDKTVGFSSQIQIKLDLRTQYSSSDWYEQVLANKKSDGLMYANYIKQPFNYQNRGGYQRTNPILIAGRWLGGLAIGQISRTKSFNKFVGWATASAFAYGVGKYFCDELMKDAITCDAAGSFKETVTYAYESYPINDAALGNLGKIQVSEAQYVDKARLVSTVSARMPAKTNYGQELRDCKWDGSFVTCVWIDPEDKGYIWQHKVLFSKLTTEITTERLLEDRDLLKYFDEVCVKFPSECVNEPTNGKNVNDVVLTGGSIGGSVSVVGPPYTNPITGVAQQDKVIIGGASSGIGVNSGTNDQWKYTPTLGQSATLNPTQVTTIPRPDLTNTDTAPVARPNDKTGGVVATPPVVTVPDVNIEFPDFTDIAEFCQQNPTAAACVKVGTGEEAESILDNIKIPEINLPTEFSKDNFLPSTAACPAPTSIVTSHGTIMYSYDKHCEIAAFLRPIILIMATITGLFIIIRSKD